MIDSLANNKKIHPDYPDPSNTEEVRVGGVNRKDQDRGPFDIKAVRKIGPRYPKRQTPRMRGR